MAHRRGRLGQGDHMAPSKIDHDSVDIVADVRAKIDVVTPVVPVLLQDLHGVDETMNVVGAPSIDQATEPAGSAERDPPGTITQPLDHSNKFGPRATQGP